MNKKDTIKLLKRTRDSIYALRQKNHVLQVQVDTFEKCYDMFRSQQPEEPLTIRTDICKEIECAIEEMENPNWKPCNVPFDIIKHNTIKSKKR